jgi:hypothetical protein
LFISKTNNMGIILKGILGGFSGTVGTVVGGTWKGINYIKSLPVISNTDPTPRQLEQREKFRTVVSFLRPLLPFIQLGYKSSAVRMSPYNAAMAYNYKHALTGTYPSFSIDYSFAVLSAGALPNVLNPVVAAAAGSTLNFSWQDNSGSGTAVAADEVLMVVYCPATGEAFFTNAAAQRNDGTASVNAAQFSGKVVHSWIACLSVDGKTVATSIYTGQVTVS